MTARAPRLHPSILSADFARLADELARIPSADAVHVDVMDNHFVPNLTLGLPVVERLLAVSSVPLDVHLMIAPVDPFIQAYADAGADLISAHVEAGPHIHRTLQAIRATGRMSGVALNPGTPAEAVRHVLDLCDMVVVMSVNPGFGGQKFIHSQVEKIAALRAMIGDRPIHIQVDGGVDPKTAPIVAKAGADVLVAGSAVFKGGSVGQPQVYGNNIRTIRDAARGLAQAV